MPDPEKTSNQLTMDGLRELSGRPLPKDLDGLLVEMGILDSLVTTRQYFQTAVPDLQLRVALLKRRGALIKIEILLKAGLPLGAEDPSMDVVKVANICIETADMIRALLERAEKVGLKSEIIARLKGILE